MLHINHTEKNELKANQKKYWCIPLKHNTAFVAAMEDALEVYSRLYDESYPVVCMDEKPVQFFADFRTGVRSRKDGVVYEDYQYIRNGTVSIFLFAQPLAGCIALRGLLLRYIILLVFCCFVRYTIHA